MTTSLETTKTSVNSFSYSYLQFKKSSLGTQDFKSKENFYFEAHLFVKVVCEFSRDAKLLAVEVGLDRMVLKGLGKLTRNVMELGKELEV